MNVNRWHQQLQGKFEDHTCESIVGFLKDI
jgi:hypothetical protein